MRGRSVERFSFTSDSEGLADRPGPTPRVDPTRNRPRRWTQRHELVLRLHLVGWRTSEIAGELRYSAHRVSMVINSPLFQDRKAALLRELAGDTRAQFLDEIRRTAIPNVEFMCAIRDDDTLPAGVRLRAAKLIAAEIDRLMPRGGR